MNRLVPLFALLLLPLLLSACARIPYLSSLVTESRPDQATLADLEPIALPPQEMALPKVDMDQLAQIYRAVLAQQDHAETRVRVLHRLADIEMLGDEALLSSSDAQAVSFAEAIDAYESLLAQSPDYPLGDQILYQLSKAYDLSGDAAKSIATLERLSASSPQSEHVLEADFRRAERYFVESDYARAELTYGQVIAGGEQNPYYTRALYMQGWSRFKQGEYQASIASFTGTLDQLLGPGVQPDSLARGERELVQDCLRVLAITFSNLQGTQSIALALGDAGERSYTHLAYEALGTLYLSQERFRDSAETYASFRRAYPRSNVAHIFQLRVIEAYESGGFPEMVVSAKRDYVEAFSVFGAYFSDSTDTMQSDMRQSLRLFIEQLATHYHALAQAARSGENGPAEKSAAAAEVLYGTAADFYQAYLQSFPDDPDVPRMAFLLAESRYESGDYDAAIPAYEWVAYRFPGFPQAADAAYAGILAYDKLDRGTEPEAITATNRARVASELLFSESFSADSRAPSVLGHAASSLLELAEYDYAVAAADRLTRWQPVPAPELLAPAWLVMGHSQFELQQFAAAEQAYQGALALMQDTDPRRIDTVERIAAAIYRQAETVASTGNDLETARQFERVLAAAPHSKIRANAQYDAAAAYMRAGDLDQANALLVEFRQRYPQHELSASIAAILVANYESLEQWSAAARELDLIRGAALAAPAQREALLIAAQYYDRAGDRELAIDRYRSYAHNWEQPLEPKLEAMSRLAELYAQDNETDRQLFWAKKIIQAHALAGDAQTARSRYLAAASSSAVAESAYEKFVAVQLSQPVRDSLRSKKQAMTSALNAYRETNEYGIEQYSTLATFRMGAIYQQLSAALMGSPRPAGLDALALEQYELMLEEQAFPFEEKAIAIHQSNARRSWDGVYDQWVQDSFTALATLVPARYQKLEQSPGVAMHSAAAVGGYPVEVDDYNHVAIDLRKQGKFAAAEQAYIAALVVYEAHADTHRNLGILYDLYRGDQARALRHFRRYQALATVEDRMVAGWIADLERQHVALVREFF